MKNFGGSFVGSYVEPTEMVVTTPPPNGDGMIGEIVVIGGRRNRSDITGPRTVKQREMIDIFLE